jgi:hypothetical protein
MAKSTAQRVREAEASHRERGEKNIRVWVPDTPDAIRQVRELASKLCAERDATVSIHPDKIDLRF